MKFLKENWIISIKQLKCSIYYCNLRLNHIIGVIGIILSIVVIFLALKNVSWVYRLVAVCAIIYCLIDIEQKLEEDHAITKIDRNIIVVIGSFYIGFSIICAFINIDLLLRLAGITGSGYLGFKSYQLVREGILNKKLKLADSLVATFLGVFPAILLIVYAFIAFWIILLALTLLYNLIHLIVRIKIERGSTNRQF